MIVGGYSLHLYCDGIRHRQLHPHKVGSLDAELAGRNATDCFRQARAQGWRFDREQDRCLCARCWEHGERF